MKILKKTMAFVLMMAMVLGMSLSVFAQEVDSEKGGSATITITNASKGETYTVYKVFDATVTGNNGGSIAYKGEIPTALEGLFENVGSTEYVQKKAGVTDQQILSALKDNASSFNKMAEAQSNGEELVFTNLPYGYYVVTSTQNSGGAVTVTSTNPNAEIQDKNSTVPVVPNDGKTVDDTNVAIGQTLTYTLKFTTANYEGSGSTAKQITSYIIHDTLPSFLKDVVVTSIKIDGEAYTVDGGVPQFNSDNKIVIPWTDDGKSLYNNGAEVVVTYTAVVTDTAAIAGSGNTNTFAMTYTTSDGEKTPEKNTDSVTVKTYAIAIKKVDDKGNALSGATFQLPFYVKTTPAADGAYIYAGTTKSDALTNSVTTPASGEIVIKGVEADTYSISETDAPEGYNKLTAPVSVEAVETSATETSVTKYIDEDGNVVDTVTDTKVQYTNNNIAASAVFVVNKTGALLPSTGGMGTTIFYVIGAILVVGAGIVLVSRRRMFVK